MTAVDVVIVNWNTGPVLAQCLESVADSKGEGWILGSVVVVDNASADDSLAQAADALHRLPSVVLRNDDNRGFGRACNQGARAGQAPFVLFLNPDARLEPTAIERIVRFLASPGGRSVGLCGGDVVDGDGQPSVVGGPFPTVRSAVGHATGLTRVLPSVFPRRHPVAPGRSERIDYVIGAFAMARRTAFDEVGGFDERFFMYYEEVDLALRMLQHGWISFHLADASVVHLENVSSAQVPRARLSYWLRSRHLYARAHWTSRQVAWLTTVAVTVEPITRAAVELARGRSPWAAVAAHTELAAWLCRAAPEGTPHAS